MNMKTTITGVSLTAVFILIAVFVVFFHDKKPGDTLHEKFVSDTNNANPVNKNELVATRHSAERFRQANTNPFNNSDNTDAGTSSYTMDPAQGEDRDETEHAFDENIASEGLTETVLPKEPGTNSFNESVDRETLQSLIARQEAYYTEYVKYSEFNGEQPDLDNADMPPRDEYKEQIDQQMIFYQAQVDGYETGNPLLPAYSEPTTKNAEIAAQGECYFEINQEQIFESAKINGNEIPEVNSNSPNETNMLVAPDGVYADQISEVQTED